MYSPIKGEDIYKESLNNGFKESGDSDKKNKFEIVTTVFGRVCEGMKLINIYIPHEIFIRFMLEVWAQNQKLLLQLICEYGYEDIADELQNLYLSGNKKNLNNFFQKSC